MLIHREWHNIDILIEFEDTVIAIENKIRSTEHSNQLVSVNNNLNMGNKLNELENDVDFQELVDLLKKPNVFNVLKLDRYEIRHSNFIAWLLDPSEKHGLNDTFLNFLLSDILNTDQFLSAGKLKWIKRESVADIDLFIEFENLLIVIENKFESDEHSNQLTKYREYVHEHYPNKLAVFVYLTPEGRLTKNNNEYIVYSYHRIAVHLRAILNDNNINLCNRTTVYIEDYLHSIQSNIMKSNKENLLAAELYNKYADVIKFINENANSDLNYISNKINLLLSKHVAGYVKGSEEFKFSRFTTVNLNSVLSPVNTTKRRWINKEPLLFEFSLEKENAQLVFLVSVSNFNVDINNRIDEVLSNGGLSGSQFRDGWRIYNNIAVPFDYSKYLDEDYIQEKFNDLYILAEPTVRLVEHLILTNKEKFMAKP